jgi:hypothetical protein
MPAVLTPNPVAPSATTLPPPEEPPPAPLPSTQSFEAIAPHDSPSSVHPAEWDADGFHWLVAARGPEKIGGDLIAGIRKVDAFIMAACEGGDHLTILRLVAAREAYCRCAAAIGVEIAPLGELTRLVLLAPTNPSEDVAGRLEGEIRRTQSELDGVDDSLRSLSQLVGDDARFLSRVQRGGNRVAADFDRVRDLCDEILSGHGLVLGTHGYGGPMSAGYDDLVMCHRALSRPGRLQPLAKPYPTTGAFDICIAEAGELLRRKAELMGRLDELAADHARVTGVIADGVKAAVKLAKGQGAVVTATHAALALMGPELHRDDQAIGEVGRLTAEIQSLLDAGLSEDGNDVATLKAEREALAAKVRESRSSRARDLKARAVDIVRRATAGEEPARAELEYLSRRQARSFAQGFHGAIKATRYDRAVIRRLEEAIPATTGDIT